MFSKPAKPRSIASQLVLLFTPAAAALLSCALAVLYVIVVRHAFAEDNEFLADKMFALRANLKQGDSPKALQAELTTPRAGERPTYWVRIIDADGRTVAETPGMEKLLPSKIFPGAQHSAFSVSNAKDYRTDGKLFSVAAGSESVAGKPYIIQVGQDRSADEEFTREFRALLAIVLTGAILATAITAITVTKRGLRPLAEMTRSLSRVGPMHLTERVAPVGWPRELQPLAEAFDQMLERLEQSFTRLSQFSADLAHELRTPVANILGHSQVSLIRERSSNEYREVIESNVAECEQLSALIDNLLFLARADASRAPIEAMLFDAKTAIQKIISFYDTMAEEQHVTIRCEGEGEIYADPMLFNRAFSNVIENALRFTPAGGTVTATISAGATATTVSVADTGSGIAAAHIPRLFDRFYQTDTSRSSAGTGLGLALVKSIMNLHGGIAAVQSEVGRGTTLTLTFPNKPVGLSQASAV